VQPPTLAERRALLRALLIGRGIERAVANTGARDGGENVLAAIAAASGLEPFDRLVVPRSLIAAHLAAGADPSAVAAARLGSITVDSGRIPRSIGAGGAPGLALGIALALRRADDAGVSVAILDRRWIESDQCRTVLSVAAERRLPLAFVSLAGHDVDPEGLPVVDRRNLEAVRAATREAADAVRGGGAPVTVVCGSAAASSDAAPRRARFRSEPLDPVTIYERRLLINGFSRAGLNEVRAEAATELERALTGLASAPRRTAA
jgi:hypothetical protein